MECAKRHLQSEGEKGLFTFSLCSLSVAVFITLALVNIIWETKSSYIYSTNTVNNSLGGSGKGVKVARASSRRMFDPQSLRYE